MIEIKRNTHIVIKTEDTDKYLSKKQKKELEKILFTIATGRRTEGKSLNCYIVCNEDEPYSSEVHGLILQRELERQQEDLEHVTTR